jgi:hypothetical protein
MAEHEARSFVYEHCDVPAGVPLAEWRLRLARQQRRARVAGGLFAAIATFAPAVMSVRIARNR